MRKKNTFKDTLIERLNDLSKDELIKIIIDFTTPYLQSKMTLDLEKQKIKRNILTNFQEVKK